MANRNQHEQTLQKWYIIWNWFQLSFKWRRTKPKKKRGPNNANSQNMYPCFVVRLIINFRKEKKNTTTETRMECYEKKELISSERALELMISIILIGGTHANGGKLCTLLSYSSIVVVFCCYLDLDFFLTFLGWG